MLYADGSHGNLANGSSVSRVNMARGVYSLFISFWRFKEAPETEEEEAEKESVQINGMDSV